MHIHVQTCIDPVAIKTYEDLKTLLEEKMYGIVNIFMIM